MWKLAGPWYTELKSALGTAFDSKLTELVLTDDSDRFVHDAHAKLEAPNVKHLFLIQNMDESDRPSSCKEVIKYFESRPCDVFSKVWDIRLGAPEEFMIPKDMLEENALRIHKLGISQSNASSSGEDCAKEIYKQISYFDLKHPSTIVDEERLVKTCSHTPSAWVDSPTKDLENTWPLPRKMMATLEQIRVNTEHIRDTTGATAEDLQDIGSNVRKIDAKTDTIAGTTDRTQRMIEETGK